MYKTNVEIFSELRNELERLSSDKKKYCQKLGDFTRAKKLTFVMTFCIITNMLKKTLTLELSDCFNQLDKKELKCTASAFCQARQKMKTVIFIDMNKALLKSFYRANEIRVKRWNNFLLEAVDGSTVNLPDTEAIRAHFGGQKNQHLISPMARIHTRYDVLNELVINSELTAYKKAERVAAAEEIWEIREDTLSLYDRGYAGFAFFYLMTNEAKREYVCRVSISFNNVVKAFVASGKASAIVEFSATSNAVTFLKKQKVQITKTAKVLVRLVRVILDDGSIEILATSLMDEERYPSSIFKALYALRWGVETFYDLLKNKFQVEIFSGKNVLSIEQDFHAAIFTSNVHSLLVNECQPIVNENTKHREGTYKVNKNVALGLLKNVLVELFILPNFEQILQDVQQEISKETVLSKKKKKRPRKWRKRNINGKYVSMSNYKRAI